MSDYDVVIVGAGIGGLATGSLLAQQGRKVLVLDRHNKPGGYATNFERNGFTFDVSLHALNGAKPGSPSYRCLEACGVAGRVAFIPQKSIYRLVTDGEELLIKHGGVEHYKRFLTERFPDEGANLDKLFEEAGRMFKEVSDYLFSELPFWLKMAITPFRYPRLLRYDKATVDEFFSRFTKNEKLKEMLAAQWPYYGLPPKQLAFSYFSYPFYDYLAYGGYSIKGGSQTLSDTLAAVIRENGGEVSLSSAALNIHVKNNRVTGVSAKKFGRISCPTVISNISPHAVVEMTGRECISKTYLKRLENIHPAMSGFQVYLGLDCTTQELGIADDEYSVFNSYDMDSSNQFEKMVGGQVDGEEVCWFLNFFSNLDPSLAPTGKSTMGIFVLLDGDEWQKLSKDAYRAKKEALTEQLIARAESRIPDLSMHIEVVEAGSPRTMTKYTGNHQGSINGFAQTVDQSGLLKRFPMRYPVKGLYQVGAWTFPGGGYMGSMLSAWVLVNRYFKDRGHYTQFFSKLFST
ncbi:MAG: NAD(P)/FAD-dependent oxidoreductase [Candidatus Thiodiazotropha sp. L084R]